MENKNHYIKPEESKFKKYAGRALKTGVVLGALTLTALGLYNAFKDKEVEIIRYKETENGMVKYEETEKNKEVGKSPKKEVKVENIEPKAKPEKYNKVAKGIGLTGRYIKEMVQKTEEGKGLYGTLKNMGLSDDKRVSFHLSPLIRMNSNNVVIDTSFAPFYKMRIIASDDYMVRFGTGNSSDDVEQIRKWRANKSATLEKKVQ